MFKSIVTKKLAQMGVCVGGKGSSDIRVKRSRFYRRVAIFNDLGLGRSYMDGDFECDDIRDVLFPIMSYLRAQKLTRPYGYDGYAPESIPERWIKFLTLVTNQQTAARATKAIRHHYDFGNDFYDLLLGSSKTYSCGYWSSANNLEEAQEDKYRLVNDKLELKPGMRVLEIGCGWGNGGAYIVRHSPGVTVDCITLSEKQYEGALGRHKELIQEGRLRFHLMDYREIPKKFKEKFDRAFSIGMFEHVGCDNYDDFFRIVRNCLKMHGRFVLHSIFGNGGIGPFIWYYIFPGGVLPTMAKAAAAYERYFGTPEHIDNFGFDYSLTLAEWRKNLKTAWVKLLSLGYEERALRMYEFYLAGCEVAFSIRQTHLLQLTLSVGGIPGGFQWNRPHYQH
jgi:cyclopropane-fatty-acyl-phospholipid synthase